MPEAGEQARALEHYQVAYSRELYQFALSAGILSRPDWRSAVRTWNQAVPARVGLNRIQADVSQPRVFWLDIAYQGPSPLILRLPQLTSGSLLFRGMPVPIIQPNQDQETYAQTMLEYGVRIVREALRLEGQDLVYYLRNRLIEINTLEAIQVVRLAGLFHTAREEIDQLGLGTASGYMDALTVHATPTLRFFGANSFTPNLQEAPPRSVIVVDQDPRFTNIHRELETEHPQLTAYTRDMYIALPAITTQVQRGQAAPRNLVTVLHADPVMIPHIPRFFRTIAPAIDQIAEFIITIGQGHSDIEFENRKELMKEIFRYLESRGLEPYRFVLHGPGSLYQQIHTPIFGQPSCATYEILYCKLHKTAIKRRKR